MKRRLLTAAALLCGGFLHAQNVGFEALPVSSPPQNWTAVTGNWTITTDPAQVRTGNQAMTITDPATTGTTIGTSAGFVTVPSPGHYLIVIGWGKANNNNALFHLGYRTGTANTLNPSTTSSGQAPNLNDATWSRIVSVSAATVNANTYGVSLRAFRSATNPSPTTIYIDDIIVYPSLVNQPDLTAPDPVSGLMENTYTLSWSNGNDVGAVQSGHDGVVIVRTDGTFALAPTLNDQAMYSPNGGAEGVSSFVQNGDTWTVVASLPAGTTNFTDVTAIGGLDYTYVVFNRDMAYNYSVGTVVTTAPPTNMVFASDNNVQITDGVLQGTTDAVMLQFNIATTGSLNPLTASSFTLSTNGTTNVGDITSAKIYYTGNSSTFNTSNLFGSQANPSGSFSITGTQTLGPGNNYFWVVYDVSGAAAACNVLDAELTNFTLSSGTLTATIPAPVGARSIMTPMSGPYTINPALPVSCTNFQSFSQAIDNINEFGLGGAVVFNVAADAVFYESPLLLLNITSFPITFQKDGIGNNPTIAGINGVGTSDAVVTIKGCKNIVFDGIDVFDDATNTTTMTQMEYGFQIVNASGTQGSSNNTIRNSRIILNKANTATIGILQAAAATGAGVAATDLEGANHNNRYENIAIEYCYNGILLTGTAGFPDSANVITSTAGGQTIIGGVSPGDIGGGTSLVYGIQAVNQRDVEITNCIVRNLAHTGTSTIQGIYISNTSTTTSYGEAVVAGNLVHGLARLTTSTTGTVHGIRVDVSNTSSALVYNNIVHSITTDNPASANANQLVRGITHCLTGAGSGAYYHNSVSIENSSLNATSVAFWKGGAGSALQQNNIFSNTTAAQTGNAKHFAAYINAGSLAPGSNRNLYWTPNTNGFVGYAGTDYAELLPWVAAVSPSAPADAIDGSSINNDPMFISATDLDFATPTPVAMQGLPVTSPAITTDIFGNPRSASNPTIGAIETAQPTFDLSAPSITNVVAQTTPTLSISADIYDVAASGTVMLWYRLLGGTTFTPVAPDNSPAGLSGTYEWNLSIAPVAGNTFQFYITARDNVSPGFNIGVSPAPATSFTGFSPVDPPNYLANPDAAANTWMVAYPGTFTVGASGQFLNLTAVAAFLDAATLTGDMTFELLADYNGSGETLPVTFKQLNTNGTPWNVLIRPAAGVNGSITQGDPGSANPLIVLDGVDHITFDGRPGGLGSAPDWIIRNTRTATTFGPAVRFINGATNDTLRYLMVETQNTSTTSAHIHFSTSTASEGNNNNMIANCILRDRSDVIAGYNTAIYSSGTAGSPNAANVIQDNEILNFTGNGINVTATGNGDGWEIRNNSFYNTLTSTTAQTCISLLAVSNGNMIINNAIGGSAPLAGGAPWTNTGSNAFIGITTNFDINTLSVISSNTIRNIAKTGTGASSFVGIRNTGGLVAIENNTIGDPGSPNSILVAGTGATYGIEPNNSNLSVVTNVVFNTIANMTATGTSTTGARIRGISYLPNSVNDQVAAINISNNTVFNLSTTSTATGFGVDVLTAIGIMVFPNGFFPISPLTVNDNLVYNITAGNTGTAATVATGIAATNFAGEMARNTIYGIKNNSTAPTTNRAVATGLYMRFAQDGFIHDNMIALGEDIANDVQINGVFIAGGGSAVNTHYYYHNSIYLYNTSNTPTASAAFQRGETNPSATVFPMTLRNNILYNAINSAGDHFAIRNFTTSPTTGWDPGASDNNVLYATDPSRIAQWGTTVYSLADWQTNTSNDAMSVSKMVNFSAPNTADLHITGASLGDMDLAGTYLPLFALDYDLETRNNPPYIGADENILNPLPIRLMSLSARPVGENSIVEWKTAVETNSSHFEVEASTDGVNYVKAGRVEARGDDAAENSYAYTHIGAQSFAGKNGIVYYRLKMAELNGTYEYSGTVKVLFRTDAHPSVNVYPNPVTDRFSISMYSPYVAAFSYTIADISGKVIASEQGTASGATIFAVTALKNMPAGIYVLSLQLDGEQHQFRLVKK